MPVVELNRNAIEIPNGGYTELARKRFGRLVRASLAIQRLSVRDVENMTNRFYRGSRLNKSTVSDYGQGKTKNLDPTSLQKLAPLLLKISGFAVTVDDPIGSPIFEGFGKIDFLNNPTDSIGKPDVKSIRYSKGEALDLKDSPEISNLPQMNFRYSDFKEIQQLLMEWSF